MPNGRRHNQNRGPRNQPERTELAEFFGLDEERPIFYPRANSVLAARERNLPEGIKGNVGLTTSNVSATGEKVSIGIETTKEPWRTNERVRADELSSVEELASQPIASQKTADVVRLSGELPTVVKTVLMIGDESNRRAIVFRNNPHRFIRGESGPAGPLAELPKEAIAHKIADEYFIVGKKGNEEVVLAVGPAQVDKNEQIRRVAAAKARIIDGLEAQSADLRRDPTRNRGAIGELNERIRYFLKHRPIVYLNETELDFDGSAKQIEVKLGDNTQEFKGYLDIDPNQKIVTVARPVAIDSEKAGIDLESLKFFDGTGEGREVRAVSEPHPRLGFDVKAILESVNRPEPVQEEDKSIILPDPAKTKLYRDPFVMIPDFTN